MKYRNLVPLCIMLDYTQYSKFERFVDYLKSQQAKLGDEDCCCSSCLVFRANTSGIGDNFYVSFGNLKCHLGYGDEPDLLPDEWT